MALGVDELMNLEDALRPVLQNNLTGILARLNQFDKLQEFLKLIGEEQLLSKPSDEYSPSKSGIIIVLGDTKVRKNDMIGIMKELGISKERLQCHVGYEEAKTFQFRKLKYHPRFSLVLVGPMGHKAQEIGNFSSAIAMMEQTPGYPPVIRMGANELKITKSNFKKALEEALEKKLISKDSE